jgi:hypothetical protein
MSNTAVILVVIALAGLVVGAPLLAINLGMRLRRANARLRVFQPIVDAEAEASRLRSTVAAEVSALRGSVFTELGQRRASEEAYAYQLRTGAAAEASALRASVSAELHQRRTEVEADVLRLRAEDAQLRATIHVLSGQQQQLSREVAVLEEHADYQHVGLYTPRYHLAHSDDYKRRLEQLWEQQKALVKAKRAAGCSEQWSISGSVAEGRKVTDKIVKLMLRAFNGECDALIAKVRFDNVNTYEARIRKSFDDINKLGGGFSCALSEQYFRLKLEELFLTHEFQEKLQAEREEQRELKEQMREEQRALQELERAQREAEKEATRYTNALDRARAEAEAAVGAKQDKLQLQIAELEQRLRETQEQQRAISLAQQTRQGHVYILSNIGSFGENVFKIGMTRRQRPEDRVDELGDASVPFCFDVHAMIRTDDAPKLEKALHDLFDHRRLNKVNLRKEFFRATIEELEHVVRKHHGEFQLTRYAEAAHYRQTLALDSGSGRVEPIQASVQPSVDMN